MSMDIQIEQLAKQGLAANEIGEQLGLDVKTVELALLRSGQLSEEDIPEDDFKKIRERLINVAIYSKDEATATRVGMYLYDQKRGSAKSRQLPPMSLTQINNAFAAANARVEEAFSGMNKASIPTSTPGPSTLDTKQQSIIDTLEDHPTD